MTKWWKSYCLPLFWLVDDCMFSVGCRADHITVALSEGFLCLHVSGDVRPGDVQTALTMAAEQGMFRSDNQVLVDIRKFTGSVDWSVVRNAGRLAPWALKGRSSQRCAYLLPQGFGGFVTILAGFFPAVRHQAFTDEMSALRWLAEKRLAA